MLQSAAQSRASGRLAWRRKLRHFNDRAAKVLIGVGGIGVIIAILLIFAYLFYEVIPLFRSAQVDEVVSYSVDSSDSGQLLHLAIEEQSEIGMRLADDGEVVFFNISDGSAILRQTLPLPDGAAISSFTVDTEASGIFALGLNNGAVLVAAHEYETSFSPVDNSRQISPSIAFPYGTEPLRLFSSAPVSALALRARGDSMILAGTDSSGSIALIRGSKQTSLFAAFDGGDDAELDIESFATSLSAPGTSEMFIDGDQRWLFLVNRNGQVRLLDLRAGLNDADSRFEIDTFLTARGTALTEVKFLLGEISLLAADDSGELSQWFLVRDGEQVSLQKIRSFSSSGEAVVAITPEQRRKNFVAVDSQGMVSFYNTTAARQVFSAQLLHGAIRAVAISPRGDALLVETDAGETRLWQVDNEHPEVSWTALWNRVWYEGYSEPEYIWQSSASTNEFEPKYSLVPLSFGTLKAAFYAMLLAAPLAICGAVFTGYFMAPAMRRKVKPLIELMEALPTVVLGFLAGLWLAPFVEKNLLGIFSILVVLPLSILAASLAWLLLPRNIRHSIPSGWEAALLIPVVLLFGYLSFALAAPLENAFFGGDMRLWVTTELGISYDQRNALVVGFAMGFAVIPTIFSIAEDAIFTVPRQLTYGSLALGATPWQSLYRVVLPTASPGIFSALMIGMGRAVGETMIVLMATGNTPIMDFNIFEGMRTLAANIAVEIPESEVDSTHYRILFLAALVLFLFTFVFNTLAEIIRQRLRTKYSTI